jgi:hypothetical protein
MAEPINSHANILFGPSVVDSGVIARVIKRRNGSGYVETWRKGRGWIKGGATFDEFLLARPVSRQMAARQNFEIGGEHEG